MFSLCFHYKKVNFACQNQNAHLYSLVRACTVHCTIVQSGQGITVHCTIVQSGQGMYSSLNNCVVCSGHVQFIANCAVWLRHVQFIAQLCSLVRAGKVHCTIVQSG